MSVNSEYVRNYFAKELRRREREKRKMIQSIGDKRKVLEEARKIIRGMRGINLMDIFIILSSITGISVLVYFFNLFFYK